MFREGAGWAQCAAVVVESRRSSNKLLLRLYRIIPFRWLKVKYGAHGVNEMHRHTRKRGKQAGEVFHSDSLGEGMRWAMEEVKHSCQPMIEA